MVNRRLRGKGGLKCKRIKITGGNTMNNNLELNFRENELVNDYLKVLFWIVLESQVLWKGAF